MQNFLNILILVGFIQGTITSILLRRLQANKTANRFLSWIILFISLACLNIFLIEAVEFQSTFWNVVAAILPLVVVMPTGPLIYFYVQATLDTNFKLQKKDRKHFYTTFLDVFPYLLSLILVVCSVFGLLQNYNFDWGNFIYQYNKYVDVPRWISLIIYLYFTYRLLYNVRSQIKNKAVYQWLRQFTIGFIVFSLIWLVHLIPYLIPSVSNKLLGSVGWYPIYMPLIVLIYWLGINGYIISFKHFKAASQDKKLSKTVIKNTVNTLENAMKVDQLFLNPNLKLNDVVQQTNIPQKIISGVLNQHLGKSFNEYVNDFRIDEFKSRLLNNKGHNLTIAGIALECGFNSQATFQRTFKTMTKMTPSEFQKLQEIGQNNTQI